jgi:hypothetical protein
MSPSLNSRENRHFAAEMKFRVNCAVAEQIRKWARSRMLPDPNAMGEAGDTYRITSIYFDTDAFDVLHRRGSFGRSKYRIRRYGESDLVFLERKLKTPVLLSKRRSAIGLEELQRLAYGDSARTGKWFRRRLRARQLRPVCQVAYRRMARVAITAYGPIRLTLDDELHAAPADSLELSTAADFAEVDGDQQLTLELKFLCAMPALFKQLVAEFALNPQSHSKYRRAISKLGLVTPRLSLIPADTSLDPLYA